MHKYFRLSLQDEVLLLLFQQQCLERRIPTRVKKLFSTKSLQTKAGRMMGTLVSSPVHQMESMSLPRQLWQHMMKNLVQRTCL